MYELSLELSEGFLHSVTEGMGVSYTLQLWDLKRWFSSVSL